jgi:hypothetical protein
MPNDLIKVLVITAAVAFVAYVFVNDGSLVKNKGSMYATASSGSAGRQPTRAAPPNGGAKLPANSQSQIDDANSGNPNVLPHPQMSNNFSSQGNFEPSAGHNFAQLDCFPKDQLVAEELLPTEGGFADSNPAAQGPLENRNLFESAHHAGINTQSNTLKNANRQLRSDPLIPRLDVGPWNQSTYEPDTNRLPFEIGTA